ncbi:unnamed protein product [Brachionus calyciflorus]|uniref:Uncharacterized protein n=1 Tax=Brachionus calyciflorus TaxID=104777 RepID=A0A813UAE1_9BILA|nr:unnamed protein product [Brachionus calyciflorus]
MISYCENCEQTKKDLNETKLKLNEFQTLAKKIVHTDLVLRKYSDKEAECNKLSEELRNKERDYDHLNDKYKNLVKELDTLKKQNNKESLKEKAEFDKILKEKDEKIEKLTNTESVLNEKIKQYVENERNFDNKAFDYIKQIDQFKNELKQLNEKLDQTCKELKEAKEINEGKLSDKIPNLSYKNVKTSTQILNANITFSDSSTTIETVDKKEVSPKKDTTFKGFYLGSESEAEEDVIQHKENSQGISKQSSDFLSSFSQEDENANLSLICTKPDAVAQESLVLGPQTKLEKNVSFNLDDDSSSESSEVKKEIEYSDTESSSSESESSSDTSSSSDSSNRSKNNLDDLFGFQISDDEENNLKDSEKEQSFDVLNLQKEFEKDQSSDEEKKEREKIEKEKIEQERLEKEEKERQKLAELETEKKTETIVDQFIEKISETFLEDLIDQSKTEQLILEFIRDKLLNEEISSKHSLTSKIIRNICISCVDEEKYERKRLEKKLSEEIKVKLEEEFYEKMFEEKLIQLIKECCERVITENINEKVNEIYFGIVDELSKETFNKCLLDLMFEDINSATKPLIKKLEQRPKKFDYKEPENKSFKRRLSSDFEDKLEFEKRSRRDSFASEASWKSSNFFGENAEKKGLEEFVKECLADYFRKFNFKIEFTFDELDELIDRLARAVKKNNLLSNNSKFIANILIKHYINNKFIPLSDENKLNQVDESELKLFKQINMIKNAPIKEEFESITRTIYGKKSTQSSYTNYLQSKLNDTMVVKITNEEEKYVYILRKLMDYPTLEKVQEEFLNYLRVMILNNEFNETFKMRMGRMLCFVCKSKKNTDYLKCFIYDLIVSHESTMPLTFQNLILLFARIWPESLTWPCSIDELNDYDIDNPPEYKNPILFVIIYVLFENIKKNNAKLDQVKREHGTKYSEFSSYYIYILETMCNWSIEYSSIIDIWNFLKFNLNRVFENLEPGDFFLSDDKEFRLKNILRQYFEAFKLLCLNEGWQWTKNNFIKDFIKSEVDTCVLKLNEKSEDLDSELKLKHQISFYNLLVNSVVSLMCSRTDNEFLTDQINKMGSIVNSFENEKVYMIYEISTIESMLYLVSFDPIECFKLIEKWYENLKKRASKQDISVQIPQKFQRKILTVQNLNIDKLKNFVKIISF